MQRWWLDRPWVHVLSVAWIIAILILSSAPGKDLPELKVDHIDKLAHFFCYALLCILLFHSFQSLGLKRPVVLAAIIAVIYGMAMEEMQGRFFDERFFDWVDVAANSLGVTASYLWICRRN